MGNEKSIHGQDTKAVNLTGEQIDKVSDFILNAGRGNLAPLVGNHISIFIDAFYQDLIEELKKKAADKKAHATLLNQIQADINRIQGQIDALNGKIKDIDEDLTRTRDSIEKLQNGEKLDLNEKGEFRDPKKEQAFKDYEKKHGKVDRNDPAAMLAALLALEAEQAATREGFISKRDGLENDRDRLQGIVAKAEATGDYSTVQPALEERSINKLYHAGATDTDLIKIVGGEVGKRMDEGVAENKEVASTKVKDDLLGDLIGDDNLEPDTPKNHIVTKFTQAANGEIQTPEPAQHINHPAPNPANGMIG